MNATYCWDTNKLRLYFPPDRHPKKHVGSLIRLGFHKNQWQGDYFYEAEWWTPKRYDFLKNLCGIVEDKYTLANVSDRGAVLRHTLKTKYKPFYEETQKDLLFWKLCDFSTLSKDHPRLANYQREFNLGVDALEKVRELEVTKHKNMLLIRKRWIDHFELRIDYERRKASRIARRNECMT